MLSLGNLSSAGGATAYYTDGQYYIESGAKSQWAGRAKTALGLPNGPVSPGDLRNMLSGKLPNGQQLGRMVDGKLQRAPGLDMTFTMPKSSSLLINGPNREEILALHIDSVKQAMTMAEKYVAQTRVSGDVTGNQKTVYAMFHEFTSRANDPNVHTHAVVPNIALGEDGKFRSMHNNSLWVNRNVIGAAYRASMAKGLSEMGYSLREAGKNGLFEIAGVSQEAIDLFSKRSAQMDTLEKRSLKPISDRSKLVLISRPAKEQLSQSELKERWDHELTSLGTSFDKLHEEALSVSRSKPISVHKVLDNAIQDLSETRSEWTHLDVFKQALLDGVPQATVRELESEIDAWVKTGTLVQDKSQKFLTTPRIIRSQKAVITEFQKGRLNGKIIASKLYQEHEPKAHPLTSGQVDAGNIILASRDRIIGVQGSPGTGKTTMFKAALPAAREAGLKIIGIAPTATAVDELKATGVFDRVMTVQHYVLTPEGDNRTLLVIDEASLVGTENMRQVLKFANDKNMPRLALVGDVEQLSAVERGRPFADLQAAGMRTAKLDQIVRQSNPRHREAITHLTQHNIKLAFERFKPNIHEAVKPELNSHAVKMWKGTQNPLAAIIVQTNAQKAEINRLIKSELTPSNSGSERTTLKVWKPIHVTQRQKSLTKTYHGVSHIRFNRDVKKLNIRRGEIFKVSHVNDKQCSITLTRNGRTKIFKPAKHGGAKTVTELYRQEAISLDPGDRVRFTRGKRNSIVNNNDMGIVHAIQNQNVTIKLDKGKTITLDRNSPELRHIDHAWANTAHAFQGKTVRDALVVMPSHAGPLTTLESLTVSMSRHKMSVALVTDNASRLKNNLQDALKINTQAMAVFRPKPSNEKEEMANPQEHNNATKEERQEPVRQIERATVQHSLADFGR